MKTKVFFMTAILALMSLGYAFGQTKTETFKVYGNCELCQTRIETAAKSVSGVLAASWNIETKMIEVKYDESKTNIHSVHAATAVAGHDTDMHRADDNVYEALPSCCHYERAPQASTEMGAMTMPAK